MRLYTKFLLGVTSTVGVSGMAYVGYDVHQYKVYPNQSFMEAVEHYISVRTMFIIGSAMRWRLENATLDVENTQRLFLMDQIHENLGTVYSRSKELNKVKSVEDFRSMHRLTYPCDYTRYIDRMMKGEKEVLTAKEPVAFAVTSGTSGKSNTIPMVAKQESLFRLEGVSILYNSMMDAFPDTKFLNKDLKIFFTPNWRYSEKGIPIGPNSAYPESVNEPLHIYSTPPVAYKVKSAHEALYLYLLFALMDPKVGMIEANTASSIYNAFSTLESNVHQLTTDIALGKVNQSLNIDPQVRSELDALMTPNPQRAVQIREAARKGTEGFAQRIWPDLHILVGADTGTFEIYGDKLRNDFCKGVPLYSPLYAASEGLLGINIWPTELPSRYLLHPRAQFFEFIPENRMDEDQPETFLLHEVKEGETYEMVITNPSCLYRYRFGDVVKVVDFYNECPVVEFKYRKCQFLNVKGEKTSEALFYDAIKNTVNKIGDDVTLIDYCCTESFLLDEFPKLKTATTKSSQPCYHVFVEIDSSNKKGLVIKELLQKQWNLLDSALMSESYPYSSFRKKGSIAPIQIHMVKSGSFDKLRSLMANEMSATSNQYTVPRVLRKQEALKFMIDQIEE